MEKQKKKNRTSVLYWVLLFLYAMAIAVVAVYVLKMAWQFAEEYEKSRPSVTIDKYVADLNSTLWGENIEKAIAEMPHEVQSNEEVAELVKQMLSSGVSYSRKSGSNDSNIISYNLRCNGSVFGSVSIIEDESYKTMELPDFLSELLPSLRPWLIYSEEFDFNGLYSSVEVTVPSTYSVYLNGTQLGPEYITKKDIEYDVLEPYYSKFPSLPTKVQYKYEHMLGNCELEIRDENGNATLIDKTKDDSQFMKKCTAEELEKLDSFSKDFMQCYLKYTSGVGDTGVGYQNLKAYVQDGSDLDERMKQAMDGLGWAHTSSVNVQSIVLNDAINLANGVYSCDITAVAKSYTQGKGEIEDTVNVRVIVANVNGNIKAYSLDRY